MAGMTLMKYSTVGLAAPETKSLSVREHRDEIDTTDICLGSSDGLFCHLGHHIGQNATA